jgi:hypothetical protein
MKKACLPVIGEHSETNPEELSRYFYSTGVQCLLNKEGILWRGEANIDSDKVNVVLSLERVFRSSFMKNKGDEQSVLAKLPYLQGNVSYTYASIDNPVGRENEAVAAGEDGYLYIIDAKKSWYIPLSEENISIPAFVKGCTAEIWPGPDCAIVGDVDPSDIVGAIPSSLVAFTLGIDEKSFIRNPYYNGLLTDETIKKYEDIDRIVKLSSLASVYPDLCMEEVYQRYLIAEERSTLKQTASCSGQRSADACSFFTAPQKLSPIIEEDTASESELEQCIKELEKDLSDSKLAWQQHLQRIEFSSQRNDSDSETEMKEEQKKLCYVHK